MLYLDMIFEVKKILKDNYASTKKIAKAFIKMIEL